VFNTSWLVVAALDQVLTAVVAVALVVFKLTSQASFQEQLLAVPCHYLLLHILFRLVEVAVNLVQHQTLEIMMLQVMENPQHSIV
jgi:hypothetical protein